MKDMSFNEFIKVVRRAGFNDPNGRIDYARILIVLATGLINGARVFLQKDDIRTAIEFEQRAYRIEDYLRENGYFDFE